ncbi:glycogen debranching enzyme N-terminal domain-containing protein [Prolixibacteraceae bacterium Z1-6]|uniref:Glycogen debranching enzyme N-terminal domain-containing protein n=1 Tax=Draconibacterium aestuarii TaxID=2998507 RepID=A0A9X3F9A9_9BACT|nr:glycogen debranching enzyme N-terminal domain-containing protein [Prolixibacteraceae bacterium Z1-6]
MHYLQFDKEQLVNLEYSMYKEILRSNRAGSYLSTTLNGCNSRKYHGLLVCPIKNFGGEKHVLLSSLDETVIQNEAEFNLGIHRFKGGTYEPKGHKYIKNVEFGSIPKITYRVGGVVLTKERLLVEKEEQILIKYTLEEAHSPTTLRLKPFLAFRNIHQLSKANMFVNTKYKKVKSGIKTKLYDGFPELHMQLSNNSDFVAVPDWYYDIEYIKELHRGYDYLEDLFVPGYFEFSIKKGESIIFAAGLKEVNPLGLKQRFTREQNKRGGKETFTSSLEHAAHQFVLHGKNTADIIAGFPWYNSITRQTFISLPGLCLAFNDPKLCEKILDSYLKYFNDGFFPDQVNASELTYNSVDVSLWFIWVVQQYFKKKNDPKELWALYGEAIKRILNAYRNSTSEYINLNKEGLIVAGKKNTALTWMDSYVHGNPVVQRAGMAVEVNALWFNAICFALDMADMAGDTAFIDEWKQMCNSVAKAFLKTFWSEGHGYLADVVYNNHADWAVRPNMVIAVAMDYTPLSIEQQKQVLSMAKRKLLTNRGLRSLSPDHLRYKGLIAGGPEERESAVHMGAVYPWLIQFFVEGYLKIHKRGGLPLVKQIIESFEDEMTENCIGNISEMYDGNPPHLGKGTISQAWSVAGISYAANLIQKYNE